jgi:outer membrane protein assembly factor BamB
MFYIRIGILLSAVLLLISGGAVLSTEESRLIYFRWDRGIPPEAGSLPDQLDSPNSLRWRIPINSGHSTPIICGNQIFLTAYSKSAREFATLALAIDTGQTLWKRIAPVTSIEEYNRSTGNPVQATPACDGQRLYVFFGSYGLICYDLQGKFLWERKLGPFQDEYGSASSPVLVDDKVIIQQDHDVNSFLMALDCKSGKEVWKSERPKAVRSYSTPAVWTRNGRKELLVAGALELAGYDPSDGKRLWWTYGLARIVIPTPVPAGDFVYMASWTAGGDTGQHIRVDSWPEALRRWDRNGDGKLTRYEVYSPDVIERFFRMDTDQNGYLDQEEWEHGAAVFNRAQNGVLAIKPSSSAGELSDSAIVWKCSRGASYVATPLLYHGILWTVRDGGIVTKISAETGDVLMEKRLPAIGNYYSSPVSADGKILFASEQGVLSIVANEQDWHVISSRDFGERIYATPLVSGGKLFIRTEQALYCFEKQK